MKLLRRAKEALMKLTSHGYRKLPVEPVDENDAPKATETPLAEVDETVEKRTVFKLSCNESPYLPRQLKEEKDTSVDPQQQSPRNIQQSLHIGKSNTCWRKRTCRNSRTI